MRLFRRVRVWLSDLIYPGDRAIGNMGNSKPGSYKNARGCLADDVDDWQPSKAALKRLHDAEDIWREPSSDKGDDDES